MEEQCHEWLHKKVARNKKLFYFFLQICFSTKCMNSCSAARSCCALISQATENSLKKRRIELSNEEQFLIKQGILEYSTKVC